MRSDTGWEKQWAAFDAAVMEVDEENVMYRALKEQLADDGSAWHQLEKKLGFACLATRMPQTVLAKAAVHPAFTFMQAVLILSNTFCMGESVSVICPLGICLVVSECGAMPLSSRNLLRWLQQSSIDLHKAGRTLNFKLRPCWNQMAMDCCSC